jgi:hypothetical protein
MFTGHYGNYFYSVGCLVALDIVQVQSSGVLEECDNLVQVNYYMIITVLRNYYNF